MPRNGGHWTLVIVLVVALIVDVVKPATLGSLERQSGNLLKGVAFGSRDDDTVPSLGNRLVRLGRQFDDAAMARITNRHPAASRATPSPAI